MTAAAPAAAAPAAADPPLAGTAAWLAGGRRLVDVAPRGRASQSSTSRWSLPDDAAGALAGHDREFGFHTGTEADPWWRLDLDRPYELHYVIVHNRRTRLQERAQALRVEVSSDGDGWALLHQGCCHFGSDGDGGTPLILPLAGRVRARALRLSLPGITCLHLDRVQALAEPAEAGAFGVAFVRSEDEVSRPDARKVFLVARPDGFGERLRALINAVALAERFDGEFRLCWEETREYDRRAHAILPAAETFAADFLARHSYGAPVAWEDFTNVDGPAAIAAAQKLLVQQFDMEEVLPEVVRALPRDWGWRMFRRIRFSDHLERGRRAALEFDLARAATAVHLRAGDVIYGHYRLMGHFAAKAVSYPLALGLLRQLRAEGREMVVFGQDRAFCRHAAEQHGAVFAGDITDGMGLDLYQAVLFEVTLMARCAEIYAGTSGFALAAGQIAGIGVRSPEERFGRRELRELFLEALEEPAAGAVSDLQRAFAFWSAAHVYARHFSAEERSRFLAAAIACDPGHSLYRLVEVRDRLAAGDSAGAGAALEALVAGEAGNPDGTLRYVLARRRSNGRSVARSVVRSFVELAGQDHVGALLCLALTAADATLARSSAERFLVLRPAPLSPFDPDVRRVLRTRPVAGS